MKIDDLTLTLFAWDDIPATRYGSHTGRFSGSSQLGLLTLRTDEGVEGHAFLGSAMRGGHIEAASLIKYLKPIVMDQDPLERERLYREMLGRYRFTTLRAIGAVDVALFLVLARLVRLSEVTDVLRTLTRRVPAPQRD